MKKFLISCCLFFSLLSGLFLVLNYYRSKVPGSDYLAGAVIKHHRLDSIIGPKIIFAGGSNLALGLDSRTLQDSIGMPVVNLGLNAALGLDYMLNELKYSIKDHDIVVLSPEYFLEGGTYGIQRLAGKYYPAAQNFYTASLSQQESYYLDQNRKYLRKLLTGKGSQDEVLKSGNEDQESVYSLKSFNAYGDVVSHIGQPARAPLFGRVTMKDIHWKGIEMINDFCAYARKKNVQVFFLYPPFPTGEYETNKTVIDKLNTDVRVHLSARVLCQPTDFLYPDSLFFDTVYHLGGTGRMQRTLQIIQILQRDISVQTAIRNSHIVNNTAKA